MSEKTISRVKIVTERTRDVFRGRYKGYDIDIERDLDADDAGYKFYIYVRNPEISFGTVYDGWWDASDMCRRPTIEDAVHQAFIGSCFIRERKPTNNSAW